MGSKISIARCESYDPSLVLASVKKAIDSLGGITAFIKPASKVLVKPNLLMAAIPEQAVTTHPEVVRAVIKLLKEIDCKVFVGDGPSVWGGNIENLGRVFEATGIRKVCEEEGVTLVDFDKRRWRGQFPLTTWLDDCDYFINIPKLKTHELTVMTAAIKNLFGLVSGTFKTELHKKHIDPEDFSGALVDIYKEAKPALTIIDGIIAMEGDGPGTGGMPRKADVLLAGSDCVALDTVAALIMKIEPLNVPTIRIAFERGLGEARPGEISLFGDKIEEVITTPFRPPSPARRGKITQLVIRVSKKFIRSNPERFVRFVKKFIKYWPYVLRKKCVRCGACVKTCPNEAISIVNDRVVFDYSKCIACFCCQEICPAAAIKVKKSLLAKMLGL
ncbi:MAG: DUF362 domain-containing protein [Candidatus Omnitrophica bacterium]|nr:DUF362 domain-containing protein [Candidatus Omnitrophota bacterium]MBU1869051.1 DUF362 domain-containing protein [Candidatus Omnitrophota bacterium]